MFTHLTAHLLDHDLDQPYRLDNLARLDHVDIPDNLVHLAIVDHLDKMDPIFDVFTRCATVLSSRSHRGKACARTVSYVSTI